MFTGLVEATGTIDSVQPSGTGCVLGIMTSLGAELKAGDSIAVSGVCLTVTSSDGLGFETTVSPETLRVTTIGDAVVGRLVNLERPVRADERLGGHFVLGHVDGVGRILSFKADGDCYWLTVDVPSELAPYLILKGSIAIDGISLTIASLEDTRVGVQIVPFTYEHTSLSAARAGDPVNVEADVIGKYVARLLGDRVAAGVMPAT